MKNSALAPIMLLLALLVIAWGGLFGLSHATADGSRDTARSHPTAAASPRASSRAVEEGRSADRAGRTDDTLAEHPVRDRATAGDTGTTSTTARDATDTGRDTALAGRDTADDGGLQGLFDRMSYQESPRVAAGDADGSGLSGRGAAALIIVFLLIAAGSRR